MLGEDAVRLSFEAQLRQPNEVGSCAQEASCCRSAVSGGARGEPVVLALQSLGCEQTLVRQQGDHLLPKEKLGGLLVDVGHRMPHAITVPATS
jgi:hypothetical protein